jgi:toxin FitB
MIVFDTNLVSEIVKQDCDQRVSHWLSQLDSNETCTTAINLAELLAGIAILSDGKRKANLISKTEALLLTVFHDRVLPFDAKCAIAFATITADMRLRRRAISFPDCQIAAIALVHQCVIATRDVQPFVDAGVDVINPWAD